MEEYSNKKVLVIGKGKTGLAVQSFLEKHNALVKFYDDFEEVFQDNDFNYDFAVISPGVASKHKIVKQLKKNGVPVISELDLAYQNCKSKNIFAISGTNGKTTTCKILAEMLSKIGKTWLVGNIGTPFISKVSEIKKKDFVVVEVSSFQIEQSSIFRAKIGALTNIGNDHINRHGSLEEYQRLKEYFLTNMCDIAIKNEDDRNEDAIKAISFGESKCANYILCNRAICNKDDWFYLPQISRGKSYDLDFLCAFSVACEFSHKGNKYASTYNFVSLPHFRNEYVGEYFGAKVYNDSKATNIDATLFDCELVDCPSAIILGGSDKEEDYLRLMKNLSICFERIYITGDNAKDIYLAGINAKIADKCMLVKDIESAVLHFKANPLELLILSPASASFDMFKNYEERGEYFNAVLEKYKN